MLSLADTMLLEVPDDMKLATTMQALQHSIDGMHVVLFSIFGQGHAMTTYFTAACHALDICTRNWQFSLSHIDIQHFMQVEPIHWYHEQECSHMLVVFNLCNIIYEATKGAMYWHIALPATFMPPVPQNSVPAPASASTSVPTGPPQCGQNSIVRNPQYDSHFSQVHDQPNVCSHDVKTQCTANNIALLTDDNGMLHCLPYHIKGQCNDNCGSAADHHNHHTDATQDRLLTWVMENWKTE